MANRNAPNTKDRTLDAFKGRMIGGGARPNLFECELYFPDDAIPEGTTKDALTDRTRFMIKAANLPASNIAPINVPFRGRNLKVAGDRTFDPWTVTVINDEDFQLRTAFERWANVISKLDDATGVTNPASYMCDAYVQQLGRGSEKFATTNEGGESAILRTYKFIDIFPTTVSEIQLSYDSGDTLEEFDVTFDIQFYTIGNATQSTGANSGEVLIT